MHLARLKVLRMRKVEASNTAITLVGSRDQSRCPVWKEITAGFFEALENAPVPMSFEEMIGGISN